MINTTKFAFWLSILTMLRYECAATASDPFTSQEGDTMAHMMRQKSVKLDKEGLIALFEKIDTNKDEKLTVEELTKWVDESNRNMAKNDAILEIQKHDKNNDSALTWEEYKEGVYGNAQVRSSSKGTDSSYIEGVIEEDKVRFEVADKNKDGKLTVDELDKFLHTMFFIEMIDYEGYKTLKDYDTNKDSKMSKEEYSRIHFGKPKLSKEQRKKLKKVFDTYDTDKDGFLNVDEVKQWLSPDIINFSEIESKHLIQVSDINGNGVLERNEVVHHLGEWMKSRSTNYGEHLGDEL